MLKSRSESDPRAAPTAGGLATTWLRGGDVAKPTDTERFWSQVDQRDPDECWPFVGFVRGNGYGLFGLGRTSITAHRYAYISRCGPIDTGLHVDHVCHNADSSCPGGGGCLHRRCCNPAHLEAVTPLVNTRRRFRNHPHVAVENCRAGHELTGWNRYERPNGRVDCRICAAEARGRYCGTPVNLETKCVCGRYFPSRRGRANHERFCRAVNLPARPKQIETEQG